MTEQRNIRRKPQQGSAKDLLITVLFLLVCLETLLLARIYAPLFFRDVLKPTKPPLAKIAVIIDDNGYNAEDCRSLENLPYPVTISVLPHLAHTQEITACARRLNKEIMLHLPLEPYHNEQKYPDDYIIKTTMPERKVIEQFQADLKSVPYASGVNNHMGSKATENIPLMSVLFTQMKKQNLFFIDSRVTAKSICPYLAKKMDMPFAQRDIFLDNENDREYIEGQFRLLAQRARKNGYAIGIGHARPLTWQITAEQLGRLSAEGFAIVTVKEIVDAF